MNPFMMQRALTAALLSLSTFALAGEPAGKEQTWEDLFDGKTLAGWRSLRGQPIRGWTAEDGALHFKPLKPGPNMGGNDLYTEKQYANFVLEAEWKISPGGNSGIKYRMNWYEKQYLGPEYQILGEGQPGSKKPANLKGATAAFYDILPVDLQQWEVKPPGEWNQTRIVVDGDHIEHWLNGKKVVSVDLSSDAFKRGLAASKFKKWSEFGQNKPGRIMLQDHGGEVWFRHLRIQGVVSL